MLTFKNTSWNNFLTPPPLFWKVKSFSYTKTSTICRMFNYHISQRFHSRPTKVSVSAKSARDRTPTPWKCADVILVHSTPLSSLSWLTGVYIPCGDHFGCVLNINIDLNHIPALLPPVEPHAGGEALLAVAEDGLVDGGGVGAGGGGGLSAVPHDRISSVTLWYVLLQDLEILNYREIWQWK